MKRNFQIIISGFAASFLTFTALAQDSANAKTNGSTNWT